MDIPVHAWYSGQQACVAVSGRSKLSAVVLPGARFASSGAMNRLVHSAVLAALMAAAVSGQTGTPAPRNLSAHERLAKDLLKQLVEIDTTQKGSTTPAAEAVAARLMAAGFPRGDVRVLGPVPERGNLVARLRGRDSGRKPILVMAHLDVVDALPQDWTRGAVPLPRT